MARHSAVDDHRRGTSSCVLTERHNLLCSMSTRTGPPPGSTLASHVVRRYAGPPGISRSGRDLPSSLLSFRASSLASGRYCADRSVNRPSGGITSLPVMTFGEIHCSGGSVTTWIRTDDREARPARNEPICLAACRRTRRLPCAPRRGSPGVAESVARHHLLTVVARSCRDLVCRSIP